MNTTAAQITGAASTETIIEAIQRIAAKATRTADDDRVFAWSVAEIARRDSDFAAWITAAVSK